MSLPKPTRGRIVDFYGVYMERPLPAIITSVKDDSENDRVSLVSFNGNSPVHSASSKAFQNVPRRDAEENADNVGMVFWDWPAYIKRTSSADEA